MRTSMVAEALLLLAAVVSLAACSGAPTPAQSGQTETPDATTTTAAASAESVPEAAVPEHLREGQQLYAHWCAACHAPGPGHPGTQALEARYGGALPGALEDRSNLTPEFVEVFVRNGISIMPFFRKTEIDDQQLDAIAAYLTRNSKK